MMEYPDFSSHGYQIERELGHNLTGGRITYRAKDIKTGQTVVIKQFQFAQPMGNWTDYDAIHQEIRVLQKLNHPNIPCYLNSFDTSTGFCLVQEYKNAHSLAVSGYSTPKDIQQIAVKCLEILIYLQQQQPLVIHRDIKPENILVGQDKKVYLVDFGLAKLEEGEISSTIAKGTLGFMPPEQIHSRQLTKASDLYSLGATLICLLTRTKSVNIGDLIDENERINFKKKLPKLPRSFVLWLQKMVERKLDKRFVDAEEALKALNLGKNANNNRAKIFTFNPKLVKFSAVGLLSLCLLTLVVYQGNKWGEQLYILAEQHRQTELTKQEEAQKVPQKEAVIQLQENKACVGCNLSGVNLEGLFLENVNLQQANLQRANLSGTKLKGANLSFAKLQNAQLEDADLDGINLENANLEGANLEGASLIDANLKNTNLKNAYFSQARLWGTNLDGAKTLGAKFDGSSR
ncbi:pentapeptide repeat-containing protein [uncultured Nostoc sp.]|uniref:protein kinase domain-containing protein n=1 Tax=uncultured Nostoc sp. TaxID=340711 RepID=UPI0035CBB083